MINSRFLIISLLFCASILFGQASSHALQPWTTCYRHYFPSIASQQAIQEPIFEQKNIAGFNQLVFSWNTVCPKGFFRYYIRVHYAGPGKKKGWSNWLAMAESGHNYHKTLYSKDSDGLVYNHVRLELPKNRLADGFQVKIEPCEGAEVSGVVLLAASCSHIGNFVPEKTIDHYKDLESVWVKGVPMRSQMFLRHSRAEHLCSPTSLSMLVEYLGDRQLASKMNPVSFANGVYDKGLNIYGSWPCNTAHAFNYLQGKANFYVERLHSFKELHDILVSGMPVVVSICGVLDGAPKTNFDGHLILVVGYDAATQEVLCHDPAVGYGLRISAGSHLSKIPEPKNVLMRYPLGNFLQVWEARHRLIYRAAVKK